MKKYRVNVNGTVFEVEIEEMTGAPAAPAVAAAAPAAPAAPAGGEKITAPMPGTILAVNVTSGSAVKKGDVLVVLEAMKMETEIVAPADGTVADGIAAQAEQSCKNVGAILEAAGSGFDKVFKTTCFLADMGDFAAFNEVYAKYFTSKPARSCVAVKTLPKGVLCEIEAIAVK